MKSLFLPAIAAVMVFSTESSARANLLVNGSLDSGIPVPEPANLVYVTPVTNPTALTGWTIDSGSIDIVPNSYFRSSQSGYSVDMIGSPSVGSISQQITTIASDQYLMTFDFSVNPERGPRNERQLIKRLRVEAIGADGVSVLATRDFFETRGTRTDADMQWEHKTFDFVADGTVTTIRFRAIPPPILPRGLTPSSLFTGPALDNVDIEIGGGGAVPEPATLGMLGVAGIALLKRQRRAHAG